MASRDGQQNNPLISTQNALRQECGLCADRYLVKDMPGPRFKTNPYERDARPGYPFHAL